MNWQLLFATLNSLEQENMATSDVQMQHCAEDSETTIEIKIKTLDSQTYNLRVNKCVSW
jgi:hypothetical protein